MTPFVSNGHVVPERPTRSNWGILMGQAFIGYHEFHNRAMAADPTTPEGRELIQQAIDLMDEVDALMSGESKK